MSAAAMRPLASKRLVLEPQLPAHAEEMIGVLGDAAIYRFIDDTPPTSCDWLRERYRRLASRRSPDGTQQWLNWIVRHGGQAIGYVQATVHPDRGASIAFVLAPAFQGRGLAEEAARAMLGELASHHGVTHCVATADAHNLRSIALLQRLGFAAADASAYPYGTLEAGDVLMRLDLQEAAGRLAAVP
jgi:[ribosomal protein S5]-alanine N-acetyltransferase